MRKLGNAVINEYIKIFAKISTKIMLACVVVMAVGWNAVCLYSDWQSDRWRDEWEQQALNWDAYIDDSQTDDAARDMYRLLKEQGVTSTEDWRYAAARQVMDYRYSLTDQEDGAEKAAALAACDDLAAHIRRNDGPAFVNAWLHRLKADAAPESEQWKWQAMADRDVLPAMSDWRFETLSAMAESKNRLGELTGGAQDDSELQSLKEDLLIGEYRLANNIPLYLRSDSTGDAGNVSGGFWQAFSNSPLLLIVINVLIIIVAGGMISMEYAAGTIKFLLINPVKRWKILLAKYLSVLTVGMLMLLLYYIFNFVLAGIFFGFGSLGVPTLSVAGGSVSAGSSVLFVAGKYLLGSLGVLTMATFAFAISSLVRNSALAIGLGVFLLLSGFGAAFFMGETLQIDWARYILFANTDLNMIRAGTMPFYGQTVGFALIVCAVYMVIFLLTAWDAFVRRDIK